ncbi:MAG: YesL family protein [Clostridiales bacterium]|nr:YesL family protein [Clostridiales bacterium]MDD7349284.1 YesL family protein [Clostridiales bacterium]
MDRLFNVNNPIMKALSKLFDIGWLSLIYIVFCVPIVTIGAATTSLYYVSAKVLRKERGYVWSEFWHCFKLNFKPATLLWLIFGVIYALLYFNVTTLNTSKEMGGYLVGAYIALAFILTCIASYSFCLLSRFTVNVRGILRYALYMSFRHFLHTLCFLAILFVAGFGVYAGFRVQVPILLLFVPGGASFLYTFPMEHLLKKYMPKSEPRYTENGEEIVEWYEE